MANNSLQYLSRLSKSKLYYFNLISECNSITDNKNVNEENFMTAFYKLFFY